MRVFILENCPHCKRAIDYINLLKAENEQYQNIDIEYIDEVKESELANSYDYYYVPSFFDGKRKLHEGTIKKEQVKKIFDDYLGGEK